MPTFPTYHGELPLFESSQPSPLFLTRLLGLLSSNGIELKCYLYQADAEWYRGEKSGWNVFRWPAYRNLFLMIPGTTLLLSVLFGGMVMLLVSWFQGEPIDVLRLAFGVVGGVAFGVVGGVAFGVVGDVAKR
jgi:hypothetical protein